MFQVMRSHVSGDEEPYPTWGRGKSSTQKCRRAGMGYVIVSSQEGKDDH